MRADTRRRPPAAGHRGDDDRPAGQVAEDAAITARVKSRVAAGRYVDACAIDVDTHTGVATLQGVGGVQPVDKRIRLQPPASMADTNENS